MTVCESCKKLCDGLGPYCQDCKDEFEEYFRDCCFDCEKEKCICDLNRDGSQEDG